MKILRISLMSAFKSLVCCVLSVSVVLNVQCIVSFCGSGVLCLIWTQSSLYSVWFLDSLLPHGNALSGKLKECSRWNKKGWQLPTPPHTHTHHNTYTHTLELCHCVSCFVFFPSLSFQHHTFLPSFSHQVLLYFPWCHLISLPWKQFSLFVQLVQF